VDRLVGGKNLIDDASQMRRRKKKDPGQDHSAERRGMGKGRGLVNRSLEKGKRTNHYDVLPESSGNSPETQKRKISSSMPKKREDVRGGGRWPDIKRVVPLPKEKAKKENIG